MRTLLFAILLSILFIAALPSTAHTGGFNLTWGTGCWRDNPSTLQTFTCDTNEGSMTLTVSFVPDRDLNNFNAVDMTIDLQSDSPELPDWWQLTDPGGCRAGGLSVAADFASTPGSCPDPWPGQDPVTVLSWHTERCPPPGWQPDIPAANRAVLYFGAYVDTHTPLLGGPEYYGLTVTMNHQQSVGAGTCAGCNTPVTLVLNQVTLYSDLIEKLNSPIDNMCLRWQADGATPCSATPVQNRTWGQVKSLYR